MKRYIYITLTIVSLLIISGCNNTIKTIDNYKIEEKSLDKEEKKMIVTINEKEYILNLESNDTTNSLIKILPKELEMNELNGNEKYVYLDTKLPTNPYKPNKINAGDVMLYNDNCLVIFYKSFNTPYSYTKIGHIDNLKDLGKKNIVAKFEIK